VIELDAASNNGVDQMRALTEQVNISPQVGRYRVFIIDEVHMLSSQAFNAFLKTLEEPPSYAIFILATTEKNKVLPTILSRCQIYDFSRITNADIVEHLRYVADSEGIAAEQSALEIIASKADGAMRDALSIFDQVAAASGNNITYDSTLANLNVLDHEYYFRFGTAFKAGDVPAALLLYKEVRDKGFDSQFFVNGLAAHLRNLMVAFSESTLPLLEVSPQEEARYHEQSHMFNPQWYYAALKILSDCDLNFRIATDKQLLVELTLIRICQLLQPTTPIGDGGNGNGTPLRSIASGGTGAAPTATPRAQATAQPTQSAAQQVQPQAAAQQPAQQHIQQQPIQQQHTQQPVQQAATQHAGAAPTSPDSVAAFLSPGSRPHIMHPPLSAATPQPRLGERTKSIRLKQTPKVEAQAVESATQGPLRTNSITKETLERAWEGFVAAYPEQKILGNCMRRCFPQPVEGDTYCIYVDNQAQQEEFDRYMMELLTYMRNELGNDNFRLNVMLSTEVHFDRILSKPDMIKKIRDEYPEIMQLLLYLDAEVV
jgi:DNA polymerase-3 subunit gamma/tau